VTTRFRILIADPLHESAWQLLRQEPDVEVCGPFESRDALLKVLEDADALIVRSNTRVDAELLLAAPRLKVVARAGAGLENVDIDFATRRGVLVINAPDANLVAVAEFTMAVLLALARFIPRGAALARQGEWPSMDLLGFELCGRTLGIIGFGRLGREVAARARAFGMHVLVYDPYVDLTFTQAEGVEMVNFSEMLARADVLSLHTAYTPRTEHIIDAAALAQMKPGAVLVNCVHPGRVDEQALLDALENGPLAAAALDNLSQEPPPLDHPLLQHPRVLLTPHLSQSTLEAQTATATQVVSDVLAALRGDDYRHTVNLPFHEGGPDRPAVTYRSVRPYIHLAEKLGKLQGQLAEGWITRVEVEVVGEGLRNLVRPVAAVLLSGMLLPVEGRKVNWVSAPVLAHEQGIAMAQAKGLVDLSDYPNGIACRIYWQGGQRTVAGVLFGNGEARLVQYDDYHVDAYPEGYVLILENQDAPGVIGKIGLRLGQAGVNIAQWRYGREKPGGRAVSFINLDQRVPKSLIQELLNEPEIASARLVHL